ncbi:MAG TPA: VOC family protein [Dongiaceae bacterium]|jgi:predicted enzyme related to lactoylglutathione lyase
MHKSGLAGFIIDCKTDDLDEAARFWSQALHLALEPGGDPGYRKLGRGPGDLNIEVQQVDHPSRVHLDIESDDVEAEVRRLGGLGAKPVFRIKDWVVMEAPTGHRFCVVPARKA